MKGFGIGRFGHFVFVNHLSVGQHQFPIRITDTRLNLLAGDIGKYRAIAIGHTDFTGKGAALSKQHLRVLLQPVHHLNHALTRLLQRVGYLFQAIGHLQLCLMLIQPNQRFRLPILNLNKQQTTGRVQNNKIGVAALASDRNVVPHQIIVFEQVFQGVEQSASPVVIRARIWLRRGYFSLQSILFGYNHFNEQRNHV